MKRKQLERDPQGPSAFLQKIQNEQGFIIAGSCAPRPAGYVVNGFNDLKKWHFKHVVVGPASREEAQAQYAKYGVAGLDSEFFYKGICE